MHIKNLQRQGDGPLVSSQEQGALLAPLAINWLSTARCVPPSVDIGFRLFLLLKRGSGDVSSMLFF